MSNDEHTIQEEILKEWQKEQRKVDVFMKEEHLARGTIIGSDQNCILLDTMDGKQLLYKKTIIKIVRKN
jgi:RNA chaperone Hfq